MSAAHSQVARLAQMARTRLGLNLGRGGLSQTLQRFAAERAGSMDALLAASDASTEFQDFVNAVTVQHTWLFRDAQQLQIAGEALSRRTSPGRHKRIWIPACATGEEAYSLAAICVSLGIDAEILGTDINASALDVARRACYGPFSTRHVPTEYRDMLSGPSDSRLVANHVRHRVRFQFQNLLENAPLSSAADGRWDLIVCRNVLIYFAAEPTARALATFSRALVPGGTLVLGASDILTELPHGLVATPIAGRLVFTRPAAPDAPATPTRAPRHHSADLPAVLPTPSPPSSAETPRVEVVRLESPALPQPARSPLPATKRNEDHETAVARLLDGIAQHLQGDSATAIKELRAALYFMPELWPASYYLALTYEGLGRHDEARRAYARVVAQIDNGERIPAIDGHDFVFLRHDVAQLARERARPTQFEARSTRHRLG